MRRMRSPLYLGCPGTNTCRRISATRQREYSRSHKTTRDECEYETQQGASQEQHPKQTTAEYALSFDFRFHVYARMQSLVKRCGSSWLVRREHRLIIAIFLRDLFVFLDYKRASHQRQKP